MKELKVGERITLEAVEQYGCRGCFFEDNPACINLHVVKVYAQMENR